MVPRVALFATAGLLLTGSCSCFPQILKTSTVQIPSISQQVPIQRHEYANRSCFGLRMRNEDGVDCHDETSTPQQLNDRRAFLAASATAAGIGAQLASPTAANAADPSSMMANIMASSQIPPSSNLGVGLLESRVSANALNPPPYGMEGQDVFYPQWFSGTWQVRSVTKDVQAPCGVGLFGGNTTYTNAKNDIGNALLYDSRFVSTADGKTIADREYNVKSIAKVAMGVNSVVDVSMASPNKFSCLLAPVGAPSMLAVDLIVLNRRQERISENQFDCSEVVREIATPVDKPRQTPSVLKEIETTSLYTYLPETDEVRCRQRSASFLLPSNENPIAMRMWQLSQGRATDVRYYDVSYSRKEATVS